MGSDHVALYLTHIAAAKKVSGSTQSQALNAIVFLYKHVLQIDIGNLNYLRNVRRFKNIPTVLSKDEVRELLARMSGRTQLMTAFLYGGRLRVNECSTLRVQDLDLSL